MTDQIKLLLLSSSKVANGAYLQEAKPLLKKLLGHQKQTIAFIPFADVSKNYNAYTNKLREAFIDLPYRIQTVVPQTAKETLKNASAIMVGGGNTFQLLQQLQQSKLLPVIKKAVLGGKPYIGWSAGANIAGPSIKTTNDMPVIAPLSFNALHFIPFQINPHYNNSLPPGHNGETRDMRLTEFLVLHRQKKIIGLPEGTALYIESGKIKLCGNTAAFLFTLNAENQLQKTTLMPNKILNKIVG